MAIIGRFILAHGESVELLSGHIARGTIPPVIFLMVWSFLPRITKTKLVIIRIWDR